MNKQLFALITTLLVVIFCALMTARTVIHIQSLRWQFNNCVEQSDGSDGEICDCAALYGQQDSVLCE